MELARQCGLTLIGRAKGKRFVALAGEDRIVFDQDLAYVAEESSKSRRKGGFEGAAMIEPPPTLGSCWLAVLLAAWAVATSR